MKNTIKTLLLLALITFCATSHAQSAQATAKATALIYKYLQEGDCEKAQEKYEDLKIAIKERIPDIEESIAECKKNTHPSYLTLSSYSESFKAEGESKTITVNASAEWHIGTQPDASWMSYTKDGDRLTIKLSANTATTERTGSFTVNCGDIEKRFDITQAAATPKPVDRSYGQWVDLGLPSGLLWCDRNIGASSPEDYGYRFAWGETNTKREYYWSSYRYCNGNCNKLTKYCTRNDYGNKGFTDGRTRLQAGDDAASYHKGSGARMPTKDEWQELLDNTTNEWTTRNGVNGRLFTSKKNGNSIFLPAAFLGDGFYWSSSLYTDRPSFAWHLNFGSKYVIICTHGFERAWGVSVRPVRSARK